MKKMKLHIPNSIVHNGEHFKLNKITPKKNQAIRIRKQLRLKRKRSRIKHFNNSFAIYER